MTVPPPIVTANRAQLMSPQPPVDQTRRGSMAEHPARSHRDGPGSEPENLLDGTLLATMAARGIGGPSPRPRCRVTITVAPHPQDSGIWG
jgi:hypothetical protein